MSLVTGLAGGLFLAASLPPVGAWPLGLIGAALLFLGLDTPRRWPVGLAAGVGLYVPGLWWMRDFSLPGYVVATLLQAAIMMAGLWLVHGRRRAVSFPAA